MTSSTAKQLWAEAHPDQVETLVLRDGLTLVLSNISPRNSCSYHHVEPEDVFGIGFHLKVGSTFDVEGVRFETRPLDVYAAAAPRSSTSTFRLPECGFRTVSLRFTPQLAQGLCQSNCTAW